MRNHIPHQAKLEWPEKNERKPSLSKEVSVQTVQEVREWVGLEVRLEGSWHRAKRSGRGRPAVIWRCQPRASGASEQRERIDGQRSDATRRMGKRDDGKESDGERGDHKPRDGRRNDDKEAMASVTMTGGAMISGAIASRVMSGGRGDRGDVRRRARTRQRAEGRGQAGGGGGGSNGGRKCASGESQRITAGSVGSTRTKACTENPGWVALRSP